MKMRLFVVSRPCPLGLCKESFSQLESQVKVLRFFKKEKRVAFFTESIVTSVQAFGRSW